MCGISGIITLDASSVDISNCLIEMSKLLRHRGPDDEGFFLSDNSRMQFCSGNDTPEEVMQSGLFYGSQVKIEDSERGFKLGLCHRRLSILDLSPSGHQPMCDPEQNLIITYNGEIYNYLEIKGELISKGYKFFSRTDTEVIINAYKEWGKDCLHRFNGMWSFAIFDRQKNEIFCARDRFGVKPFYYYHDQSNFCFASEQKAIVGLPFVKTGINDEAVYDFLVSNQIEQKTEGFFKNIIELFPGTYLRINLNDLRYTVEEYYTLNCNHDFESYNQNTFSIVRSKTEQLLVEAIKLRTLADVKVGACLSGGIDSSVIAGIMQKNSVGSNPNFFTSVFPGLNVDESFYANEVIKRGGDWKKVTPSADELWRDLDELIYSQDIPIWSSSTYSQFRVMKLAKDHNVKVLLDGQGGDELFGGYHPHYLSFWNELAFNGEHARLKSEIRTSDVPGGASKFRAKDKVKNVIKNTNSNLFKRVINPDLKFLNKNFLAEFSHLKSHSNVFNSLNEHLRHEFCNTRLKLYLKCEDRCSMWHSVESRTPFSDDINLIKYVFSVPGNYKIHNGTLKYLLRQAAIDFLPQKVFERKDKVGYVTPHNEWLRGLYSQIINEDFTELKYYLDSESIKKNFRAIYFPIDNKERFFAFKLLAFVRWKRLFNI